MGRRAQVFQADLADPEAAAGLIAQVGEVDILILNASVQIKKKWESLTVSDFRRQVDCNMLASLLLIQGAVSYTHLDVYKRQS